MFSDNSSWMGEITNEDLPRTPIMCHECLLICLSWYIFLKLFLIEAERRGLLFSYTQDNNVLSMDAWEPGLLCTETSQETEIEE